MSDLKKRFLCSYAGGVDYEIGGRKYVVRYFANKRMPYNTGVLDSMISLVGTVRYDESDHWHEFPPRDVVSLFPGFVGVRYRPDFTVEYDGSEPVKRPSKTVPEYITCDAAEADDGS